jgi:hypothetical protein
MMAKVEGVVANVDAVATAVVDVAVVVRTATVETDKRVVPPAGAPGTAASLAASGPQAANSARVADQSPTVRKNLTPTACRTETLACQRFENLGGFDISGTFLSRFREDLATWCPLTSSCETLCMARPVSIPSRTAVMPVGGAIF